MRKRILSVLTLMAIASVRALAVDAAKPVYPNEVTITIEGAFRVIRSNGIPDHVTGQFPGKGNPNTITPQKYEYRIPAEPKVAARVTTMRMQPFGVAVNGVVFDPGAAEWWNGDHDWQYEPLTLAPLYLGTDGSHAHVQPNGAYHYHGIPTALVRSLTGGKEKPVIVGWAADGFPIYNAIGLSRPKEATSPLKKLKSSYRVKKGTRPGGPGGLFDGTFVADYEYAAGTGDLDECNGRFGITPEYPQGIYHYVLTDEFPFIPRMFRGTPDESFARRGGPGGGRPGGGGPVAGFHLIPRFAVESLNLTSEQQQQVMELEKEAKAQLAKILTAEQMKALEEARPPRFGPGGLNGLP